MYSTSLVRHVRLVLSLVFPKHLGIFRVSCVEMALSDEWKAVATDLGVCSVSAANGEIIISLCSQAHAQHVNNSRATLKEI